MDTFEIKILNFTKFKARKDIARPTWFALSNRFIEDFEFFDFTHEEKLIWIYFLSLASQKDQDVIHVSVHHANHVCQFSKKGVSTAIEKLKKIKCIEVARTRSVRGRYADVRKNHATNRHGMEDMEHMVRQPELAETDFSIFWNSYPRKVKKSDAKRKYLSEIKSGAKSSDVLSAVDKYRGFCIAEKKEAQYVMHPSSFLNGWRDWLEADAGASTDFSGEGDERYRKLFAKENGEE